MFASILDGTNKICRISFATLLLFFLVSLIFTIAAADLKETLFPSVQVTLYNELNTPVLYMCGFENVDDMLHELGPKNQTTFLFSQIGFPLRWCYLYINGNTNGFFWAYAVRLRCNKCFWRITDHLYLYRSDRNRWERQALYSPRIRLNDTVTSTNS